MSIVPTLFSIPIKISCGRFSIQFRASATLLTSREMDEFWKMSVKPRSRLLPMRSIENMSERTSGSQILDHEDFSDVFGGPPRNVVPRQLFGDGEFRPSASFYEDVFRIPENVSPTRYGRSSSRNLPQFSIPHFRRRERSMYAFHGNEFGKEDKLRFSRSRSVSVSLSSHSKSKSNSSSVLSSDDMSPLRQAIPCDDIAFFGLTTKLRPVQVPPPKWNSTGGIPEQPQWQQHAFNHFNNLNHHSTRKFPSPETISLGQNSNGSLKVSMDDLELNSPSSSSTSVVSSLSKELDHPKPENMTNEQSQESEEDDDEEDDEVMSSFVIEINSDQREGTEEAFGIDEAIAWAKEKYQSVSGKDEKNQYTNPKVETSNTPVDSSITIESSDPKLLISKNMPSPERELQLIDADIKEWSIGKETNVRLLLSTLHHILWENSGWKEIPIKTLTENSHVKKAYQKARLCLHPDKVQQRGSTFTQKYVAEKAFAILQEAWAEFIHENV